MTTLPFSEVDALVLCQVPYLDLFSAVPTDSAAVAVFVAFRGTDDTLVSWREGFEMSFALL